MKKLLLATTAALLAAPALAADLPRRSAPVAPAPVYAAPVFTWAGFYVGAQVGYAWTNSDTVLFSAPGARFNTVTYGVDNDGFIGGLHAGYNWQRGALVYGLEADIEFADVKSSYTILGFRGAGENNLRGSLRARVGYSFDRALLYVTAGLAMASVESTILVGATRFSGSDTNYGWTIGAGVEYALTNNWSTRIEYRYTDLGDYKMRVTALGTNGFSSADLTDHSVRVGVSYRFGNATSPVVARY